MRTAAKPPVVEGDHLPAADFLALLAGLYPHFKGVLSATGTNGPEFFLLLYVSFFGKKIGSGTMMPLSDVIEFVRVSRLYPSESGSRRFVDAMHDEKRFFRRGRLTRDEKREHFPRSSGYSNMVVIDEVGAETLANVTAELKVLLARITNPIPKLMFAPFLFAFRAIAKHMVERLRDRSRVSEAFDIDEADDITAQLP
jgi:hypothetical protein